MRLPPNLGLSYASLAQYRLHSPYKVPWLMRGAKFIRPAFAPHQSLPLSPALLRYQAQVLSSTRHLSPEPLPPRPASPIYAQNRLFVPHQLNPTRKVVSENVLLQQQECNHSRSSAIMAT